jgi:cell division protein FtsB
VMEIGGGDPDVVVAVPPSRGKSQQPRSLQSLLSVVDNDSSNSSNSGNAGVSISTGGSTDGNTVLDYRNNSRYDDNSSSRGSSGKASIPKASGKVRSSLSDYLGALGDKVGVENSEHIMAGSNQLDDNHNQHSLGAADDDVNRHNHDDYDAEEAAGNELFSSSTTVYIEDSNFDEIFSSTSVDSNSKSARMRGRLNHTSVDSSNESIDLGVTGQSVYVGKDINKESQAFAQATLKPLSAAVDSNVTTAASKQVIAENKQLKRQVEQLESDNQSLFDEINQLTSQLNEAKAASVNLNNTMSKQLADDANSKFIALNKQIKELTARNGELEREKKSLQVIIYSSMFPIPCISLRLPFSCRRISLR